MSRRCIQDFWRHFGHPRSRRPHGAIEEHDIVPFDLVVVNLYPFAATAARTGVTRTECVEQIDIGGPSLVRAAAKNHRDVAVATSPEQYSEILEQLDALGGTTLELREQLAAEAFDHTAAYDRAIADYMRGDHDRGEFPAIDARGAAAQITIALRRKSASASGVVQ